MSKSAFQGRKLGEGLDAWKRRIEGDSVICLGYGRRCRARGMWPLVTWLVERGYVDVLASTSATSPRTCSPDGRHAGSIGVDPEHVDDRTLAGKGYYRFYDPTSFPRRSTTRWRPSSPGKFFDELAETWRKPTIPTSRLLTSFGPLARCQGLPEVDPGDRGALPGAGLSGWRPARRPIGEGYSTCSKADQAPVVDFFRTTGSDRHHDNAMMTKRGTSVVFLAVVAEGIPADHATSVRTRHGNVDATPHKASIQITTHNTRLRRPRRRRRSPPSASPGQGSPRQRHVMCSPT